MLFLFGRWTLWFVMRRIRPIENDDSFTFLCNIYKDLHRRNLFLFGFDSAVFVAIKNEESFLYGTRYGKMA